MNRIVTHVAYRRTSDGPPAIEHVRAWAVHCSRANTRRPDLRYAYALVPLTESIVDNASLARWLQAMGDTLAMLYGISGVRVHESS